MPELSEAEINYTLRRYRYLPVAIRKARDKLARLEREAIECGRIDLVADETVNHAWDTEVALAKAQAK